MLILNVLCVIPGPVNLSVLSIANLNQPPIRRIDYNKFSCVLSMIYHLMLQNEITKSKINVGKGLKNLS